METLKKFGPVLAVEILLPGGTLLALLLYLFQHRKFISSRLSIWRSAVRLLR